MARKPDPIHATFLLLREAKRLMTSASGNRGTWARNPSKRELRALARERVRGATNGKV